MAISMRNEWLKNEIIAAQLLVVFEFGYYWGETGEGINH